MELVESLKTKAERVQNGLLSKSRYIAHLGLIEIRKIEAILRKRSDDKLAADLQDLLLRNWNESQKQAIREAIRSLKSATKFTPADLQKMVGNLENVLGAGFYDKVADGVRAANLGGYGFGLTGAVNITPTFNMVDRKAIAFLDDFQLFWVRNHYDRQLGEDISRLGQDALRQGLTKRQTGDLFLEEFGKKFEQESWRYWQGFGNMVVTRAREFGQLERYLEAGVTKFQVKATLDHRTTEICRRMHNRIIDVSKGVKFRDDMMAAQEAGTPEDVIAVASWMKPDQITSKPSSSLPNKMSMPPYHYGNCRTETVAWFGDDESMVDEVGEGENANKPEQLNAYSDEEYGEWIGNIKSRKHLSYDEELLERHFKGHKDEISIKEKDAYIKTGMDIVKNSDKVIAKIYRHQSQPKKEQLQFVFFSEQGQAVVGDDMMFHGIFGHPQKGGSTKAFEGQKKFGKWFELTKND